jgi:hypothetical protein
MIWKRNLEKIGKKNSFKWMKINKNMRRSSQLGVKKKKSYHKMQMWTKHNIGAQILRKMMIGLKLTKKWEI